MSLDYAGPPGVLCLIFLQGQHCQDTLLLLFNLPRPSLQIGWFCHPQSQAVTPGSGNLSFNFCEHFQRFRGGLHCSPSRHAVPWKGTPFKVVWALPFSVCWLMSRYVRLAFVRPRLAFTLDQLPMLLSFFSTIHKLTFYAKRVMHFHVVWHVSVG